MLSSNPSEVQHIEGLVRVIFHASFFCNKKAKARSNTLQPSTTTTVRSSFFVLHFLSSTSNPPHLFRPIAKHIAAIYLFHYYYKKYNTFQDEVHISSFYDARRFCRGIRSFSCFTLQIIRLGKFMCVIDETSCCSLLLVFCCCSCRVLLSEQMITRHAHRQPVG